MPNDPDSGLKDFFASGFYERYWPDAEDEEGVKTQSAQILALLDARQGHILDWRGGSGRHVIWFARAGLTVSLLDFTTSYLKKADERFRQAKLPINLIEADSRATPPAIQADFAVCLGNSVGFLPASEELAAFQSLHAALRPGARLLIDSMNLFFLAEPIAKALQEPLPDDGCIRSAQGHFDFATNVWHKSFSLITPDGAELSKDFSQTMYTPEQLVSLLKQAGFAIKGVFGDFAGKPVGFDSPKIVVVAAKG